MSKVLKKVAGSCTACFRGREEQKPLVRQLSTLSSSRVERTTQDNLGRLGLLPLELRLMVYGYVLASSPMLHLRKHPYEPTVLCCSCTQHDVSTHFRTTVKWMHRHDTDVRSSSTTATKGRQKGEKPGPPTGRPAFLLASRQIYNESHALLYTSNTFTIDNITVLLTLNWAGHSPRLGLIRRLRVDLQCGPTWSRLWRVFWDIVARQMTGLRELYAVVVYCALRGYLEIGEFQGPLMLVCGMREARVTILLCAFEGLEEDVKKVEEELAGEIKRVRGSDANISGLAASNLDRRPPFECEFGTKILGRIEWCSG